MCDCVCVRWHEWVQASMYPSERLMGSAACVCKCCACVRAYTCAGMSTHQYRLHSSCFSTRLSCQPFRPSIRCEIWRNKTSYKSALRDPPLSCESDLTQSDDNNSGSPSTRRPWSTDSRDSAMRRLTFGAD